MSAAGVVAVSVCGVLSGEPAGWHRGGVAGVAYGAAVAGVVMLLCNDAMM